MRLAKRASSGNRSSDAGRICETEDIVCSSSGQILYIGETGRPGRTRWFDRSRVRPCNAPLIIDIRTGQCIVSASSVNRISGELKRPCESKYIIACISDQILNEGPTGIVPSTCHRSRIIARNGPADPSCGASQSI